MTKNTLVTAIASLTLLLMLGACDGTQESASNQDTLETAHPESHDIDWFKGDIDEAFRIAKTEDKPIFFYWGAIWCPPCQEIKQTVFKSTDFIAMSKLFLPVYLDGDTDRAQAAGERFGVQGYPTMIVFNPDGIEITRIPGGIDISKYNSVLELSLNQMKPTKELVELALTDASKLTTADFTQLAYYSWGQDFKALPEDAPDALFADLAERAAPHDPIASARLYMQYLVESARKDSPDNPVRIEGAEAKLRAFLESDELTLACWDSLAYWPEIVDILPIDTDAKQSLQKLWQEAALKLRHDASLSTAEQLAGWLPYLHYYFEGNESPLPADVTAELEADLSTANRITTNAFARQSVINQMEYIYIQAHMRDAARNLLLAELDRSAAPYYFMSALGSLAEKEEKFDEALEWYKRAYDNSVGAATRLQWGASYARALIRLSPDADETILATSEALFKEIEKQDEVFTGRNFRVLRSMNRALAAWKADTMADAVAKRFVSHIESLCANQPDGSVERENCDSLIVPKEQASVSQQAPAT